jgi:hypothetical protein
VCPAYSVTIDIFVWIYGVWYAIKRIRFTTDYFCVLLVRDVVKYLPEYIIRRHAELDSEYGKKTEEVESNKAHVTNDGNSPLHYSALLVS